MIPDTDKVIDVHSNIPAEATGQFTVDESALGHIMDVLTNLYTDPELAVVREYLTNAYDAHIDAGQKPGTASWVPIQVTTPGRFNKAYIIRDYGVGMNVDDVKNTWTKYGKSTKTKSNDVVGMLGLGSKCALTYTNSFTVTGFKDGIKVVAIISKNEENIPVFHIVDTAKTDEPNGVEISIPVKDYNSFAEKTADFLKWWTPGLVTVDGAAPKHHTLTKVQDSTITYRVEGKDVTGIAEVFLAEGQGYYNRTQSYVVMGNVPYKVDEEYVDSSLRDNSMGFVAYVPMGAVKFPPNRETLNYNPNTKNVLTQISKGLFDHVFDIKIKEITEAESAQRAFMAWSTFPYNFQRHANYSNVEYKGDKLQGRYKQKHMSLDWDYQGHGQISERENIDVGNFVKGALVVTGVEGKPTSYFKKKVKHYIEEVANLVDVHGSTVEDAILVKDDFTNPWLDHLPRIDADSIKAIKLPKNPSQTGPRAEAPYDFYEKDSTGDVTSDIDVNVPSANPIYYISPADIRETRYKYGTSGSALAELMPNDTTLVILATNRFEKFLRTHTTAVELSKAWQGFVDTVVAGIADTDYLVEKLDYYEKEWFRKVDYTQLADPELVELAKVVQGVNGANEDFKKANKMVEMAKRANMSAVMPERKVSATTVTKRYPLIEHVGGRKMAHLLIYVNAVYREMYAPKP